VLYKPNNSKNSPFYALMFGNSVRDSNYGPWPDKPLRFIWLKGGS